MKINPCAAERLYSRTHQERCRFHAPGHGPREAFIPMNRATAKALGHYSKYATSGFVRVMSTTSDEQHDFTPLYVFNLGSLSWHERRCKKCGVVQRVWAYLWNQQVSSLPTH